VGAAVPVVRFIGDTRVTIGDYSPQTLSESSFIVAGGVRTEPWHGVTGWFEAGSAMSYVTGHLLPDYRGGFSGQWRKMPESTGWFADTSADGLYMSRFDKDYLLYDQSRAATWFRVSHVQLYWNGNFTLDLKGRLGPISPRQGPEFAFRARWMPKSMWITANLCAACTVTTGLTFNDIRLGVWYAFTSR
jgi:hypothetical protein